MTGLTAEAAKAIVELGIDLSAIETRTQLAEGIDLALSTLGLQIVPATA